MGINTWAHHVEAATGSTFNQILLNP